MASLTAQLGLVGCSDSHGTSVDSGIVGDAMTIDTGTPGTDSGPGVDTGPEPVDVGPPTERVCLENGPAVDAVREQLGLAYLGFYRAAVSNEATPWSLAGESGTACEGALDPDTCAADKADFDMMVEQFWSGEGPVPYGQSFFTITDENGWRIETDVMQVVGEINSAEAAHLFAVFNGYYFRCDEPVESGDIQQDGDGFRINAVSLYSDCPWQEEQHVLSVSPDGTITVVSSELLPETGACAGRRPPGLSPHTTKAQDEVGAYFANMAHLEAAAVIAFECVCEELAFHDAPADLVAAAHEAVDDEVRHARSMRALATRFGAVPAEANAERFAPRPLFELAMDNAVEGCVRETFGALVGHYQAEATQDPEIARVMAEVASDETRHAELSWRIAAWVEPMLSETQRQAVEAARQEAIRQLREEVLTTPKRPLERIAGLPSAEAGAQLFAELESTLWA